MSEFNEDVVGVLRGKIEDKFRAFLLDSKNTTVKAQARRASKLSSEITALLKEYRRVSIK